MEKFYNIKEFAELLGVTPQTLRNWNKSGKLKPTRLVEGGKYLYTRGQLAELIGQKADKKNAYYLVKNEDACKTHYKLMDHARGLEGFDEYDLYEDKEGEDIMFKLLISKIAKGKYKNLIINDENVGLKLGEVKLLDSILEGMGCKLVII